MTQSEILSSMGKQHSDKSGGKGRGEIVSEPSPFDCLPEDCISNIISFTSPRDACVAATVSKTFESAVKSDIVWDKFIPPEYVSLIPRSRVFSSKKELYFALCNDPLLIDDGKKSIWLEKASGKRCIMLSAMNLSITWGDSPHYWQWIPIPESRFEKVAELLHVSWFEIRGRTNTHVLSPRTGYSAYIVFKEVDNFYGFKNVAIEAAVGVVGQEPSKRFISFDKATDGQFIMRDGGRRNFVKPKEREDGWMEIELGEFFNEGGFMNSDEIEMSALETLNWKRGLIIQGTLERVRSLLKSQLLDRCSRSLYRSMGQKHRHSRAKGRGVLGLSLVRTKHNLIL